MQYQLSIERDAMNTCTSSEKMSLLWISMTSGSTLDPMLLDEDPTLQGNDPEQDGDDPLSDDPGREGIAPNPKLSVDTSRLLLEEKLDTDPRDDLDDAPDSEISEIMLDERRVLFSLTRLYNSWRQATT